LLILQFKNDRNMTSLRHLDTTAILLIHCPDQKGILAAVTDFINVNKGNIIYLDSTWTERLMYSL